MGGQKYKQDHHSCVQSTAVVTSLFASALPSQLYLLPISLCSVISAVQKYSYIARHHFKNAHCSWIRSTCSPALRLASSSLAKMSPLNITAFLQHPFWFAFRRRICNTWRCPILVVLALLTQADPTASLVSSPRPRHVLFLPSLNAYSKASV